MLLHPSLPQITVHQEYNANRQTKPGRADAKIPSAPITPKDITWRPSAAVDVYLDRAREAETEGDAVVHHRTDQTGRDALVFLADGVAEEECGGGERHVHAPRGHDGADEKLRPVGLGGRGRGDEDVADGEAAQGDGHDPGGTQTAE